MKARAHRKRLQEVVDCVFGGNVKAAAHAAGLEQPTLHRILAGKVREPRLSTLERLSDRYGVPLDWIIGRTSVLPRETGPATEGLPRWWVLLALYHERARRDDHQFIQGCDGKTKTELGKRLVQQYWEMRRIDRTRLLFNLCVQVELDTAGSIGDRYHAPLRSLLQMETEMTRLAREGLQRLGEGPQPHALVP